MKIKFNSKPIVALGSAALLLLGAVQLKAQEGPPPGNFDPQQMRQRLLQRLRDQMEVADDSEWKVIAERIGKVLEARRAARAGGGPGGFGPPPGGPGGPPPSGGDAGGPPAGGPPPGDQGPPPGFGGAGGPPPGGPGGFNPEPNPALDALRKAIESKAPATELKARIAEFKADQQQKRAALESAQDSLRQLLSARQEAIAVVAGLL